MKRVSIGQVKRDLSELINEVAHGQQRIVLTSRGKPKAALVSLADLDRLQGSKDWDSWFEQCRELSNSIRSEHPDGIELDNLWTQLKADQESHDDRVIGR